MTIFARFHHNRQATNSTMRVPRGLTFVPELIHWLDTTPVESSDRPCRVHHLDVTARVSGIYAEVTQTIQIANPNHRPISTQLTVPLPDRAVICGYALEIDGQLVEGVVVPKEKARVIFETEQRRQADPGLAEAVRGNVYSTRVYPVPPNGMRTVRLTYLAPLLLGDDGSATLDLPMPAEQLAQRTMRISVERLDAPAPQITGLDCATLQPSTYDWSVETDERDILPQEPVRVSLPALPDSFVLLERDTMDQTWFCISSRHSTPAADTVPDLRTLTVLWDASGSRADQDHTPELELLEAYAAAPTIARITLVVFADHVREVLTLTSPDELIAAIKALRYDGGTDFNELSRTLATCEDACAGIEQGSGCVLFTDGLDTLSLDAFSLPDGCSCISIVSGTQRDAEALRQGCRGPVLDLAQAPQTPEQLAALLTGAARFGVADITGSGIADVCDVSAPTGGRRVVIGRVLGGGATIQIGQSGEKLVLDTDGARESNVLSRAWAARRITLLSPRKDENAAELLRLGKRYGMASPATSLLVLETLDQWLRYDIEPPQSLTEMHTAWERSSGRMRLRSRVQRKRRHIEDLIDEWRDVMRWWETDYSDLRKRVRVERERREWHLAESSAPTMADFAFEDAQPTMAMPIGEPSFAARRTMAASAPRACVSDMDMEESAGSFDGLRRSISSVPEEPKAPSMNVEVRAWRPDTPYLKALDEAYTSANVDPARDAYFAQRTSYATTPSFFLDCAGWFIANDDADFGISVLTNLAELRIEDAGLLRILAWRLREAGRLEMALVALRRVLRLRHEDSQSHRDVALVLSELARETYAQGDKTAAAAYARQAADAYKETALTPWDRRAMAISLFAVEEYNVLQAWVAAQEWDEPFAIPNLWEGLTGVPDCDLRVTLAWDADETDVDIHVTEPSGEEAYYAHRMTSSGGRVSEDITDGYGPELYEIRHAEQGGYTIRAHYYASHQQTVFGPATCTLTVYSDWGRPNQTQTITSMRLDREREMIPVGTAFYGDAPSGEAYEGPAEPDELTRGMSPQQVSDVLGSPDRTDESHSYLAWMWDLENDHELTAIFVGGALIRVLESMPWGDETILLS